MPYDPEQDYTPPIPPDAEFDNTIYGNFDFDDDYGFGYPIDWDTLMDHFYDSEALAFLDPEVKRPYNKYMESLSKDQAHIVQRTKLLEMERNNIEALEALNKTALAKSGMGFAGAGAYSKMDAEVLGEIQDKQDKTISDIKRGVIDYQTKVLDMRSKDVDERWEMYNAFLKTDPTWKMEGEHEEASSTDCYALGHGGSWVSVNCGPCADGQAVFYDSTGEEIIGCKDP